MKVLADSNIFIDFWNVRLDEKKHKAFSRIFSTHDVIVCGVVRAEILHGAYSEKNRKGIHDALALFENLSLDITDWEVLGDELYEYRTHGVTVPFSDAIIAAIALKYDIDIWTRDKHFLKMQSVIKRLKIIDTDKLLEMAVDV